MMEHSHSHGPPQMSEPRPPPSLPDCSWRALPLPEPQHINSLSDFYNSSIHSSPCPFILSRGKCRSTADCKCAWPGSSKEALLRDATHPRGQGWLITNAEADSMSAGGTGSRQNRGEVPESGVPGGSAGCCSGGRKGSWCMSVSPKQQTLGR